MNRDLAPIVGIITTAASFFADEQVKDIRATTDLSDDGAVSQIIEEALKRWFVASVPSDQPKEHFYAAAGRKALELLGATDVANLDGYVAQTFFFWAVQGLQPELCTAITDGLEASSEEDGPSDHL